MVMLLVVLAVVALAGIAATVVDLARDGYRRIPTRQARQVAPAREASAGSHLAATPAAH